MTASHPQYSGPQTEDMSRRQLLTGTIFVLSTVILGAMSSSAAAYLLGGTTKRKTNDWTDAGQLPDLRPDAPEQITFERSRIDGWKLHKEKATAWVVLMGDGKLAVFSPLCTHLGCAYRWSAKDRQFNCPCHGSAFNARGAVIEGPAQRPLDRFETKLEGSRLWLGPTQS